MNILKEQLERIQVPDNIDFVIKKAIRKEQNHKVLRRGLAVFISISFVFTALFGTCYAYPEVANELAKIPFIGAVFEMFTDKGLKNASDKGLTDFTDLQETRDELTVAIKEVYYDQAEISIGWAVKGGTLAKNHLLPLFYYNDKCIGSGSGGEIPNNNTEDSSYVTSSIPVPKDLPDKFELRFIIRENNKTDGKKFEFIIPLDRNKSNSQSKKIDIMKTYKTDNRTMLVKDIVFSPASVAISFKYTHKLGEAYELSLVDKNGNPLVFKRESSTTNDNEIKGDTVTEEGVAFFEPIEKIPEELVLYVQSADKSVALDANKPVFMIMELKLQ